MADALDHLASEISGTVPKCNVNGLRRLAQATRKFADVLWEAERKGWRSSHKGHPAAF